MISSPPRVSHSMAASWQQTGKSLFKALWEDTALSAASCAGVGLQLGVSPSSGILSTQSVSLITCWESWSITEDFWEVFSLDSSNSMKTTFGLHATWWGFLSRCNQRGYDRFSPWVGMKMFAFFVVKLRKDVWLNLELQAVHALRPSAEEARQQFTLEEETGPGQKGTSCRVASGSWRWGRCPWGQRWKLTYQRAGEAPAATLWAPKCPRALEHRKSRTVRGACGKTCRGLCRYPGSRVGAFTYYTEILLLPLYNILFYSFTYLIIIEYFLCAYDTQT